MPNLSIRVTSVWFLAGCLLSGGVGAGRCLGQGGNIGQNVHGLEADLARHAEQTPNESDPSIERNEIVRLSAKGRSQFLAGDAQTARVTFQQVEFRDPENAEAKKFLQRIAADSAEEGELNREKTRTQLLEEVTKSWQRPGRRSEPASDVEHPVSSSALERKLDELILPSVSFTRAEIGQVVVALTAIAQEVDSTRIEPRGINIVLLDAANKTPTVTLSLRNTSLRRVLDFVTESVGYHYEVDADAVVIRPGSETTILDTAFFPVTRATASRLLGLTQGNSFGGPMDGASTMSGQGSKVPPSNGDGSAIRTFLQQAGVNFDNLPGATLAYDGSALIVTQTTRNLVRIRNILTRYRDVRQVEIEAKFMEVQEGALEELGVNWSISQKATQHSGADAVYKTSGRSLANVFSNSSSSPQGSIVRPALIGAVSQTIDETGKIVTSGNSILETLPILNNAPQLPGAANLAAGAGALASITGIIGEFDVNAVVRALAQRQGTDLLSAPRVTVLSGNSATITVAQEMRYPQSFGQTQSQVGTGSASGGGSAGVAITAGTPQEFTARNVGVELKVAPTVEDDDYSISLDLNPKVTEFDGFVEFGGPSIAISGSTTVTVPSGFYQPIFSVRDISTRVTLWDGATLVMGGLTREEVKKVNDKVPVLGNIPFLGRMFRSKGESAQKRNLLIFVTANLVNPGGSPKKQRSGATTARPTFQSPTIVTPAGAEPRDH
jgi:general secretion pathway protein D